MMIEAMTFDVGGFPSASLHLVSSDGLAPLPLPMPSEGSVKKFLQFMGGDGERPMDISCGLAALSHSVESPASETGLGVKRKPADAPEPSQPAPQPSCLVSHVSRPFPTPEEEPVVGPRTVVMPAVEASVCGKAPVREVYGVQMPVVAAAPVDGAPVIERRVEDIVPRREAAPVSEAPIVERHVEDVASNREATFVAETPVAERRVEDVAPHREATPVAEAPITERHVEDVVPHREATPVSEAPIVERRVEDVASNHEATFVAETPVTERHVEDVASNRETAPVAEAPVIERRVEDVASNRETASVSDVPAIERHVEDFVPRRETTPVVEAPVIERRAGDIASHRQAAPVSEAPIVERNVEDIVPRREATPVAEAPIIERRTEDSVSRHVSVMQGQGGDLSSSKGVDMKVESLTFELHGNPPVKVQLVSSAGLSPLPVPGLASRFKEAMEENTRDTEVSPVHKPFIQPSSSTVTVNAESFASVASAAAARTEVIVETVNEIVEAIAEQISVTSALAQGNGEIRITLRPTVLDGSTINLSAADGELTVVVTPATPAAAAVAAAALPRLEAALAEHAPAFHHVAVALATAKKGKTDEAD